MSWANLIYAHIIDECPDAHEEARAWGHAFQAVFRPPYVQSVLPLYDNLLVNLLDLLEQSYNSIRDSHDAMAILAQLVCPREPGSLEPP